MNIERTRQTQPVQAHNTHPDTISNSETAKIRQESPQDSGTQVKLSQSTRQFSVDNSQDIDFKRVGEIKAKMENGELQFDSNKITSALVNDIVLFS